MSLPAAVRLCLLAAAALGGVGLGVATGTVAALRHDRPMHAVGRTYHARLERRGQSREPSDEPSGVAWIDEHRDQTGLVRFSRGAGLPDRYPDVHGLAIRLGEPGGHSDLLLSSSGLRGLARFALVPRRSPLGGPAGSLMPFRAPRGPLVIAAEPVTDDDGPRPGQAAEADLTGTRWRLLWSGLTGPWRPFAVLTVGEDAGPTVDSGTRFHPVSATPPGLPSYRWAALLRSPAYRAAQLLGHRRG